MLQLTQIYYAVPFWIKPPAVHALHEAEYLYEVTTGIQVLPEKETVDKETVHPIRNPKIYYWIYKGLPWDHILSQLKSVHILTTYYFCNILLNIILLSTGRFFKWSLAFMFSN
jgi:hypothetical protein